MAWVAITSKVAKVVTVLAEAMDLKVTTAQPRKNMVAKVAMVLLGAITRKATAKETTVSDKAIIKADTTRIDKDHLIKALQVMAAKVDIEVRI